MAEIKYPRATLAVFMLTKEYGPAFIGMLVTRGLQVKHLHPEMLSDRPPTASALCYLDLHHDNETWVTAKQVVAGISASIEHAIKVLGVKHFGGMLSLDDTIHTQVYLSNIQLPQTTAWDKLGELG